MAKNQVIVAITANTKGLVKGLGESKTAMEKLGGVAKGAVGVVAGVGAALAGIAAVGGFARVLNIDTAQTKLKALGYDAEQVTGIMDSALASVKGTAYGLGDAATLASQALAAGIPQGEKLTKSLTLVTNTAALAGTSLNDMGSIFAKVWTAGIVQTTELNQIADRGIPIWTTLADSVGVSVPELKKMVSAGQVTAEMFETALGPAVEGIAGTMGTSFTGMLSNAKASLSRLGAMFAGPLLEAAKPALGEFTKLIDGLSTLLQPAADAFAAFVGGINFEGLSDKILGFFDGLSGMSPTEIIVKLATNIADGIVKAAPRIAAGIGSVLSGISNALVAGLPVILEAAVILLGGLIEAVPLVIPPLIATIATLLPPLIETLSGMIPQLLEAAVTLLTALVEAIPQIIPPLILALIGLLPVILESIIGLLPAVLDGAIELFTALVDALPIILPTLVIAILKLLPKIIETVLGMIPKLVDGAVRLFTGIVDAIPKIIPELIPAILDLLPKIVGALIGMIPTLIKAGVDLVGGLVKGLWNAAGSVGKALLNIVKDAVGGFLSFLGIKSPSRLFAGFGKDTVQGLVQGLTKNGNLIDRAMDGLSGRVEGGFSADLHAVPVAAATGGGYGNTYNIHLSTLNATAETGRVIVEAIRDYEKFGGRL